MKLVTVAVLIAVFSLAYSGVEGSELICILGGDLACEINCISAVGQFAGACNEANECICGAGDSSTTWEYINQSIRYKSALFASWQFQMQSVNFFLCINKNWL